MNQRWSHQRDSFRPAGELINPTQYEVGEINSDAQAKSFVLEHHYSGTYPAARYRFGLYRGSALVGVAVFSVPMHNAVITKVFPIPAIEGVELGRFVLLDDVPGNGESWFVARCFELLGREGIAGVVSFSDPVPRSNSRGESVFSGHVGTIYQASNGCYLGRGSPGTLRLLRDGSVFSARAISKLKNGERGWEHCAARLIAHGADRQWADLRAWAVHWIAQLTTPLRHPGNHKYAWPLNRRLRRHLPYGKNPFPKQIDRRAA